MLSIILISAGLVSAASAHIIMTNPIPFGAASLNNNPLDGSGSDFPCKGVSYQDFDASNRFAQGSTQKLKFKGTAVHGGGSCQVSVTTDLNPTRDSVWKVIKSIEGGCPAKDATGNIGNDANAEVPFTYDFTIPKDLAAGEYVFAWTWFNKIGNREMWMNCAPLTVTGGGGSNSFYGTLPDMFIANIGVNGCAVLENKDVEFPNPGHDVDRFNGETDAFNPPVPTGNGECPLAGTSSRPGSPPVEASFSSLTPTQPTQPFHMGLPDHNEDPQRPDCDATTSSFPAGVACSVEGQYNCVGGTSFQRCAAGVWSAFQSVAAGTTCKAGTSAQLDS